jgi:hypothetical protein
MYMIKLNYRFLRLIQLSIVLKDDKHDDKVKLDNQVETFVTREIYSRKILCSIKKKYKRDFSVLVIKHITQSLKLVDKRRL